MSDPSPASVTPPPATPVEAYDIRHGIACALVSVLIGTTQSLGINMINSNLTAIQGSLGVTAAEIGWLTSAFWATYLSTSLLMTKFRLQYGLRLFTNIAISCFLAGTIILLFADDMRSAIFVRAMQGFAAACLSTLALLYMVESMPKKFALVGLVLGIGTLQLGAPLSRILPESLLEIGRWQGLNILDMSLAVIALGAINAIRLMPPPRQKVFCPGDIFAFVFYAISLGLMAIVLTQGRTVWWTDSEWLGIMLAISILCFGVYLHLDLHRSSPLLDLKWLFGPFMRRLLLTIVLFRLVLSEQTVGAVGLLNALGMNNDQMQILFVWILLSTVLGFIVAGLIIATGKLHIPGLVALLLVCLGAWLDSNSTSLTRPSELYFSQSLIAFGSSMYLSSAIALGFTKLMEGGMKNFPSFAAVFSGGQALATLAASAWLSTFVVDAQKLHFSELSQYLSLANPQVASRISQMAAGFSGTSSDRAAATSRALATLGQQANVEASVRAYNDTFEVIAAVAALTFLWLLIVNLMRNIENKKTLST
ncbi:MFS transporter [Undibacterium terreum]|uniref:MFS transporter n=1 Tax=Undibacterium terreum TaxID=1224302 RepID=A0A916UM97_9BURK|nr:MFS transporter [Undibacterium terreum]GGC75990.1 MFS transporter [Undibacterium terreum]